VLLLPEDGPPWFSRTFVAERAEIRSLFLVRLMHVELVELSESVESEGSDFKAHDLSSWGVAQRLRIFHSRLKESRKKGKFEKGPTRCKFLSSLSAFKMKITENKQIRWLHTMTAVLMRIFWQLGKKQH
jgi:hypothetical protein